MNFLGLSDTEVSRLYSSGEAPLPRQLVWELTLLCNLRCHFCFRDTETKQHLSLDKIEIIVSRLPSTVRDVTFTGGEVFIRRDMETIIEILGARSIKVGVLTNGTLLTSERLNRLINFSNLDHVMISLDGLPATHDSIRGQGMFAKSLTALETLGKRIPWITVNTVITKGNLSELPSLLRSVAPYIHRYSVEHQMFNSPAEIKRSAERLGAPLNTIATSVRNDMGEDIAPEEIRSLFAELRGICVRHGIAFEVKPFVADQFLEDFLRGDLVTHPWFCGSLLNGRIDPLGNLVFCHILKTPFQSLLGLSFEDAWNADNIKEYRKRILGTGYLPEVCTRCHYLRPAPPLELRAWGRSAQNAP